MRYQIFIHTFIKVNADSVIKKTEQSSHVEHMISLCFEVDQAKWAMEREGSVSDVHIVSVDTKAYVQREYHLTWFKGEIEVTEQEATSCSPMKNDPDPWTAGYHAQD